MLETTPVKTKGSVKMALKPTIAHVLLDLKGKIVKQVRGKKFKNIHADTCAHTLSVILLRMRLGSESLGASLKAAFHPYVNNLCFVVNLVLSLSVPP